MKKKVMTGVGATVLAVMLMSGTAYAHFCTNASRSDQGRASVAEHSRGWLSVDEFLREEGVCEAGVEHVLAGFEGTRWENLAIHGRTVMAKGLVERDTGLLRNGRGVDHLTRADFQEIVGLFSRLVGEVYDQDIC